MAARRGNPRYGHADESEYDYQQWSPEDYPQWSGSDEPSGDPPEDGDESASGRHRARRPGPLVIAAIITAVLVAFGIGAVVLAPVFDGGSGETGSSRPGLPVASGPDSPDSTDTPPAEPSATESASAQPSQPASARLEDAVLALVNAARAKADCRPVHADTRLRTAARKHSADMAARTRLDHQGSDGSSPADRVRATGYNGFLGENIAAGQRTAQQVMDAWLADREHRSNILNCRAKAVGVGVAYAKDGTPYWTQDFGRT